MDQLSKELEDYLIRLHKEPNGIGDKMVTYTERLLNLLNVKDAELLEQYYGILGFNAYPIEELAHRNGTTPDVIIKGIEVCLRKLAVTPEWQMMKPMGRLRAIKLK